MGWIFRGQTKGLSEWPLLPKAGRPEYFSVANDYWREKGQDSNDLGRFREWRRNAIAYCDKLPSNDFECLAFAQHYGLATRLLDWTTNPLVALFFAVENNLHLDGVVVCHNPWLVIEHDKISLEGVSVVAKLQPSPFDRRVVAQSSTFTYHPFPKQQLIMGQLTPEQKAMETEGLTENLVAIQIPAKLKQILQRQLSSVGVSRKTLFPDLEGLSSFVNWSTQKHSDGQDELDSNADVNQSK